MPTEALRRVPDLFHMAGSQVRLKILFLIEDGETQAGDLFASFDITNAAIIHHLVQMRLYGLVERRRAGKTSLYSLTPLGHAIVAGARELSAQLRAKG